MRSRGSISSAFVLALALALVAVSACGRARDRREPPAAAADSHAKREAAEAALAADAERLRQVDAAIAAPLSLGDAACPHAPLSAPPVLGDTSLTIGHDLPGPPGSDTEGYLMAYLRLIGSEVDVVPARGSGAPFTERVGFEGPHVTLVIDRWTDPVVSSAAADTYQPGKMIGRVLVWDSGSHAFVCGAEVTAANTDLTVVHTTSDDYSTSAEDPLSKARVDLVNEALRAGLDHLRVVAASPSPGPGAAPAPPGEAWAWNVTPVIGDASVDAIAIDGKGDVVLAASYRGAADAGDGPIDGGDGGEILVKLSPAGVKLWSKVLGKDRVVEGVRLAIGPHDEIAIAASLSGTTDLGGGALTTAGDADILLAELGPDGAHRWSHRFGAAEPDRPAGVAVDDQGDVAVAGYYAATVDFGGRKLDSPDEAEMFVASYQPDGALRWAKRLSAGGPDRGELHDVAVTAAGGVVAIGNFTDKVDLAGKALVAGKGHSIATFVAAFAPSGAIAWDVAYAPGATTLASRVAIDHAGGVALAGDDLRGATDDNGTVSFDVATGNTTQGSMIGFVAALTAKGAPRWFAPVGPHGMTDMLSIATDGDGVVAAGTSSAGAPFGEASLRAARAFVARLGADGKVAWARAIPGARDPGGAIVAARAGAIVVAADVAGADGKPAIAVLRAAP